VVLFSVVVVIENAKESRGFRKKGVATPTVSLRWSASVRPHRASQTPAHADPYVVLQIASRRIDSRAVGGTEKTGSDARHG
jgi:hypothetical protein